MPNAAFEEFKQSSENMMKKFMLSGALVMVLMLLGAIALGIGRKEDIKAFKIVGVVLIVAAFVTLFVFVISMMTGFFDSFKF